MISNGVQLSKSSFTAEPNDAQLLLSSSFTAWLIIELEQLNKTHKEAIPLESFINHILEQLDIRPSQNIFFPHLDESDSFDLFSKMPLRLFIEVKIIYLEQAKWVAIDKSGRLTVTDQVKKHHAYIEYLMKQRQGSTCPGKFSDKSIIEMIKRCIQDLKPKKKDVRHNIRPLNLPKTAHSSPMEDYATSLANLKQNAVAFEQAVDTLGCNFEDKKQLFFADQVVRLLLSSVTESLGIKNKYGRGLNIEGKYLPMLSDIDLLPAIAEFREAIDDFLPKFDMAVKTQEAYSVTSLASQTFHAVQQKLREAFEAKDETAIISFHMAKNATNPGASWGEKGQIKYAALGGTPGRPKKIEKTGSHTARHGQVGRDMTFTR